VNANTDTCPRCKGFEPLTIQVGMGLRDCDHPWHFGVPPKRPITPEDAATIQREAETRIAELGTAGGCEASAARSFEEGRLSVLRALGLWRDWSPAEVLEQRRRDLNEALPHGRNHR
jgi:hypothetical protein